MGLNCGCPAGAHIPDLNIPECKESMGQLQKVLFQRVFKTAGVKNSFTSVASPALKASWTALLSASNGSKVTVSPYIQNPTSEPGAARTFGSGNQTMGGIPIVIGREPTTFNGIMYEESQGAVAPLKDYSCENLGVYLVDENGMIGCLVDNVTTPTAYYPIPVKSFFIGDKKLGGLEEPDSNTIQWSFLPNWSDKFKLVPPTDFNPLTDLANQASA